METSPETITPEGGNLAQKPKKKIWLLIILISIAFFFNGIPNAKGRPFYSPEHPSNLKRERGNTNRDDSSREDPENAYDKIILEAARRHEVHPALIKAIIKAESSYNSKAVSKRGARGLMQLMPGTARAMGVKNSFNPSHNINGGTRYFKHLLDEFEGNIRLALAAYNAGVEKVKKYGRVPPYKATRSYITKVISYYREYRSEMRMMARS
ncbi:lytic transglycosylase domain-containing protein [Desulfococcus sp.]|uniref:lytic transglycosylase domain-containing protein n=1 Tax=Desulfococcus sp. TaxID=2025834 RepID=UPI003593FA59